MPKPQKEATTVTIARPGQWEWNDETNELEFVSINTTEEDVSMERRMTKGDLISDFHLHLDGPAQFPALNDRGRHSIGKTLSSSSVKQRQKAITIEDVKQVALSLLQDKHSPSLPVDFLPMLKVKELDEFLAALLLYLSCFFEHRSLEEKLRSMLLMSDQRQVMTQALAKVELSQRKLAVCYSSLLLWQGAAQHHHTARGKTLMSSLYKEHHLHECLYNFSCYVAWLTFGRKDLQEIQENVGHLLYSDRFNPARRSKDQGDTKLTLDGPEKEGPARPKQQGPSAFDQRNSQRFPSLSSIMNQRSPLVALLLPLPKEQSPHLFQRGRPRGHSLPQAPLCDTKVLMEELDQQLTNLSFGILGKPLSQFSCTTLRPQGAKTNDREEEDEKHDEHCNNEDGDSPGFHFRGSWASLGRSKLPAVGRQDSMSRANTEISRATTEALSSDTE